MEFGNTAVQLSNISSLSTSEVKGRPRKGVIILLVGFASLFVHWLLGAAIILVGVFIFLQSCKMPNISYLSQQMLVGIFQSYLEATIF